MPRKLLTVVALTAVAVTCPDCGKPVPIELSVFLLAIDTNSWPFAIASPCVLASTFFLASTMESALTPLDVANQTPPLGSSVAFPLDHTPVQSLLIALRITSPS